jgi:hypothetical protein
MIDKRELTELGLKPNKEYKKEELFNLLITERRHTLKLLKTTKQLSEKIDDMKLGMILAAIVVGVLLYSAFIHR